LRKGGDESGKKKKSGEKNRFRKDASKLKREGKSRVCLTLQERGKKNGWGGGLEAGLEKGKKTKSCGARKTFKRINIGVNNVGQKSQTSKRKREKADQKRRGCSIKICAGEKTGGP